MAISSKSLGEGETVLLHFRTHPKVLAVALIVAILALAAGVFSQVNFPTGVSRAVWVVVVLVVLWWVVRPFVDWLASSYDITDRRLITRSGIIVRRRHDIRFGRVSDVESEISLIDRIFGCGTIIISDASTNGSIKLHDIPDVENVQVRISELLHTHDTNGERA